MRFSIRGVVVIALVGLQLAAVATILISSYLTSEKVLLVHARELMMNVANETINHSINFLGPAEDAADLSQRLAQQDVVNSENSDSLEKYFFEQLRSYPQFAGIFYGNEAGDFVYVKRDAEVAGAAYRTKVISHDAGLRQVALTWRDGGFGMVSGKDDPQDAYDPRKRPWYRRASEQRGVAWTDPYIFFTSRNPGITVAAPVMANLGRIKGVVGVDIEIGEISDFIGALRIGKSGAAFILNRNGDVLAHPDPSKIKTVKADASEGLRFTRILELADPASQAAFRSLGVGAEGFRITRPTFTSFDLDGEAYHAVFTPLPQARWPWTVGIYVPEDDFLGTIKDNRRQNIIIALMIAAITAAVGLIMAHTITRPIAALYRRADAIARGRFSFAEPFSSTYEELSRAGTAFNRMATWLEGYKADNETLTGELRAAHRELEVRVEERTGALSNANQQLRDEIEERKYAEIQLAHEVKLHEKTEEALREALREARDRANASNVAKSRFLSNMSHELRTPLNVILGFGQMLKQPKFKHPNARADGYVGHILESGNLLLGLIDQVLDLAKIEAGKMLLSIEPVQTAGLLATAVDQAKLLARQNGLELVDETQGRPIPDVFADPDRLKQALMNLLSNAIKYNREGGRVTVGSKLRGRYLRIIVEDTGIGIPADKQDQLFEPFNRLGAENSAIEGTGVGLALTKEIAGKMGGHIGFESEAGRGSSFWIDLRVAPADAASGAGERHDEPEPAKSGPDRPMRVLYVGGHDLSGKLICDALEDSARMTIETAPSAEAGLAKAKSLRPDVVLLEINLPGMDGYALLERLRREAGCAATPVIALSADAMPEQVQRGEAAGFAHYLTKPIDLKELQSVVARAFAAA